MKPPPSPEGLQTGHVSAEDSAIVEALRLERAGRMLDAIELADNYRNELADMAESESIESQLASVALKYQAVREQLPEPGDSRRTLRKKADRRAGWTRATEKYTFSDAKAYSGRGFEAIGLIIMHRGDQIGLPPLLFPTEPDAMSLKRQGWYVGYPSDMMSLRSSTHILQLQIKPQQRCVGLEAGFAVRDIESDQILAHRALYHIIATRRPETADTVIIRQAGQPVAEEDLYFPMGLLLEATRIVAHRSPYPA